MVHDVGEPFGDSPLQGVPTMEDTLRHRIEHLKGIVKIMEDQRRAAVDVAYEVGCPNSPHPGIAGCAYCLRVEEALGERKGLYEATRAEVAEELEIANQTARMWEGEARAAIGVASSYERERDNEARARRIYAKLCQRFSDRMRDAIRTIDRYDANIGQPPDPDPERILFSVRTTLKGGESKEWCTCLAKTPQRQYHDRECPFYRDPAPL